MNSHFQSSETTCTRTGRTLAAIGRGGSSSWLPIQAMPPTSSTTIAGIAHTTSSICPE